MSIIENNLLREKEVKMEKLFVVRHARLNGRPDEKEDCFKNIGFWQARKVINLAEVICCLVNNKQQKEVTIHDIPYAPNAPSEKELCRIHADTKQFVRYMSLGRLHACDDTKIIATPDTAAKETAMLLATALTQGEFETASWLGYEDDACEKIKENKSLRIILVVHYPFAGKFISLFLKKLGYIFPHEALPEIDNAQGLCVNLTKTPRPEILHIKT